MWEESEIDCFSTQPMNQPRALHFVLYFIFLPVNGIAQQLREKSLSKGFSILIFHTYLPLFENLVKLFGM